MTQIIPAILEQDFTAIQAKVERAKAITDIVQLDVMDGQFVPNVTYRDTTRIATLDIALELHLMIDKPEFFIRQWALPNVRRMIVHYEALHNLDDCVALIRQTGAEVGVAINPATPTSGLIDRLDQLDMVLVMGVNPGFSGQDFNRDVLEKIKELKKARPQLIVAVDGGVNVKTAPAMWAAGADVLGANSALWQADDLVKRVAELIGTAATRDSPALV